MLNVILLFEVTDSDHPRKRVSFAPRGSGDLQLRVRVSLKDRKD
jgi:hypothetical protein